jgi:DEAD/DEAH box helicase domain-containing protein
LRAEGLWTDLHDTTVEGAAYFRTAEHSAQQPAERLEKYEKLFKAAQINLLSCSTTMEMGVDIGGISAVSMNNVPPHPANYLQRTGRAGRRGESRSLALTLCKDNPHDQMVFRGPTWPFVTRLAAPAVRLSSAVIVQRHVNALLLSDFLRMKTTAQVEGDLTRLTCGWFFAPDSARGPADEMMDRLRSLHLEPALLNGLQMLVRGTPFDGASERALTDACVGDLGRVTELWRGEQAALQDEMAGLSGRVEKNDAAIRGLQFRVERLSNEYLLRWMVGQGFLPVHGFPSSLVSFDTINAHAVSAMSRDKGAASGTGRDDNPLSRRQLASRDRVTALREYAPGAEVVMDGVVYRSEGVTLNWHAPAAATDLKENQNLRVAWRCTTCGASGSHPTRPDRCTECTAELDGAATFEMLVPNGFAVDFFGETHNDVTQQSYVPVEEPWVHAAGEWVALPNPQLGRYRSTPHGSVVNYSAGPSGSGYAICLACGRAAPMSADDRLPEIFRKEHYRLRGGRKDGNPFCPGSSDSWKVKPHLRLGHHATTDVFELQLRDVQGVPLGDRKAALTIAVALRDAAAAVLGVDSDEIGFGEKPVALPDGSRSRSILLFDKDAAGLVSSIEPLLARILREARAKLECQAGCDAICEHCLLQYDTRFLLRSLDRHRAVEVFDSTWLQQLELPEAQRFFGHDSTAEAEPLFQAVTREWGRASARRLVLPLHGNVDRWDLGSADVRGRIYRWAEAGRPVRLLITSAQEAQLRADDCALLYTLAAHPSIEVHKTPVPLFQGGAAVAAAVETADGVRAWACADDGLGCPAGGWGASDTVVVTGPLDRAVLASEELSADSLRTRAALESANELQITDSLDGSTRGFGKRFWDALRGGSSVFSGFHQTGDTVIGVTYSDRYITSPLAAALLVEAIHGLKEILDDRWEVPRVRVVTAQRAGIDVHASGTVFSDWSADEMRRDVLERSLDNCAIDGVVRCIPRADLDHARLFDIETKSGKHLRIHLDQGFGYWRASHRANKAFDFSQSPQHQAQAIAEMDIAVQGSRYPTYVFVTSRD